jgi:hypothetical protein
VRDRLSVADRGGTARYVAVALVRAECMPAACLLVDDVLELFLHTHGLHAGEAAAMTPGPCSTTPAPRRRGFRPRPVSTVWLLQQERHATATSSFPHSRH